MSGRARVVTDERKHKRIAETLARRFAAGHELPASVENWIPRGRVVVVVDVERVVSWDHTKL